MTERAADADIATDPLAGLESAGQYPLLSAILNRRSRRIMKGLKQVPAGSLSYTSTQEPQPLTPLEEALLIATTGVTGISMHDVPFKTPNGRDIVSSWMHTTRGRAASSPDNVQVTVLLRWSIGTRSGSVLPATFVAVGPRVSSS